MTFKNDKLRFMMTLIVLTSLNACDDDQSPSSSSAGEIVAGQDQAGQSAGMPAAGVDLPIVAGMSAGTENSGMGGEQNAGESGGTFPNLGGDQMDGGFSAGAEAGESAGDSAGDLMGGLEVEPCRVEAAWVPPEQRGSIYLTHYLSPEVIEYQVSGERPREAGRFTVGGEPQDAEIDSLHQLYAVALNLSQEVEIYRLPAETSNDGFTAPELASRIGLSPNTPRRVLFDSARARLFVYANPPLDGNPLESMLLYIFDISDPTSPVALTPEPSILPVSSALAIETRAGVLALVETGTHLLHLFDVSGNQPRLHQGQAIDLRALFPEDGGQSGFQLRNLTFDPLRGRLFMARSHGIASEVITLSYPPIETKPEGEPGDDCPEVFTYDDLTVIPDAFEVSEPISDRPNLLDAFMAIPMMGEDFVLFITYAWRNSSVATMVTLMKEQDSVLRNQTGCGDYEGFGCFYTSYYGGSPSPYNHRTDGPGCVDQTHGIFAGAGLEDDESSQLFLFRINRDTGGMTPFLTEAERNLSTSAYPLVLSCY